MTQPRIILLCSSRLALATLQQFAFMGMLAAVVVPTHCDEMAENVQFILKQANIPIILIDKASYTTTLIKAIEEHQITLGLIVTFSFLLPPSVYNLPTQGFYNIHPGPLPQYRGADPIFQQIKNKEKQAGITIHRVEKSFDTGPVVMQEMIRLQPTDTYGLLTNKLGQVAARLSLTLLKLISFDTTIPSKQQEELKAQYYKRHTAKDVTIYWEQMSDSTIVALINACNPWNKGASTQLNGQIVRLLEATPKPSYPVPPNTQPGTILCFQGDKMITATANTAAIGISLIYTDDGFLSAGRLSSLGVLPGQQFQSIL